MTTIDVFRKWNMPDSLKGSKRSLRYSNPLEKGIYWYWFSRYIRERDVMRWGVCISCGKPITFESCDAGHFVPANGCGRDLLFDERNVNAECSRCNAWDEMHLIGYAKGLDFRYGPGTADALMVRYRSYKEGPVVRDWKRADYERMILALPNYASTSIGTDYSLSR